MPAAWQSQFRGILALRHSAPAANLYWVSALPDALQQPAGQAAEVAVEFEFEQAGL